MSNGVWTNNWKAAKNLMLLNRVQVDMCTITASDGTVVQNQTTEARAGTPFGVYTNSELSSYEECFLRLGRGTAIPAETDYKLGTNISSSNISYLSIFTSNPTWDSGTNTWTRTVTMTAQYIGSGSVTITEWGIFISIETSVPLSGSSPTTSKALVYHELLDSPVTLQQYESATFILTLTLTLPSS